MQAPPPSLRERQRLDTWASIHNAAAELVIRDGWASATVDKIAANAGISTRTFFNYFASKEDAVLGAQQLSIPDDALAAFEARQGDLLERTVQLTMAVIRTSTPAAVSTDRRKQLISDVPELRTRAMEIAGSSEALIEPILTRALAEGEESDHGSPSDEHGAAQALMMLAGTIIRFAFRRDPVAMSGEGGDTALAAATAEFREAIGGAL